MDIIQRRLVHGFGPKLAIFPPFFGNIGQENVFNDILERKNAFLRSKNKNFKESRNGHYSKEVSPWFWSKIGNFTTFFLHYTLGKCVL